MNLTRGTRLQFIHPCQSVGGDITKQTGDLVIVREVYGSSDQFVRVAEPYSWSTEGTEWAANGYSFTLTCIQAEQILQEITP